VSRIKTLIRAVLPVIRTDWSLSLRFALPSTLSFSLFPFSLYLSQALCLFFFFSIYLSLSLSFVIRSSRALRLLRWLLSPERTRSSPFSYSLSDSLPVPHSLFFPHRCRLCHPYCSRPRSRVRSRFASTRANREMVNGRRDEPDPVGGETFARRRRRRYGATAPRN